MYVKGVDISDDDTYCRQVFKAYRLRERDELLVTARLVYDKIKKRTNSVVLEDNPTASPIDLTHRLAMGISRNETELTSNHTGLLDDCILQFQRAKTNIPSNDDELTHQIEILKLFLKAQEKFLRMMAYYRDNTPG